MDNKGRFKKAEREELVERFLSGKISTTNLPYDYVKQIYEQLLKYGANGLGEVFTDPYNPFYSTTKKFNRNLARFASYKMVQNIHDINTAQKVLTKEDFAQDVQKVQKKYLFDWLETEYKTTQKMSSGARKWLEVSADKETFPYLEYVAIIDENTRDEHAALDGTVKPVNHSFWDTYFPPNGYNCRCSVNKLRHGTETDLRGKPLKEVDDQMNILFKHNPGKAGKIFNGYHPYFGSSRPRLRSITKKEKQAAEKMAKKLVS